MWDDPGTRAWIGFYREQRAKGLEQSMESEVRPTPPLTLTRHPGWLGAPLLCPARKDKAQGIPSIQPAWPGLPAHPQHVCPYTRPRPASPWAHTPQASSRVDSAGQSSGGAQGGLAGPRASSMRDAGGSVERAWREKLDQVSWGLGDGAAA